MAESIINGLTFILAYIAASTIAGAFAAWIVEKLGDDTAATLGFTSLNPLAHVDLFGLFCLMLTGLGWGRYVPINPSHFTSPFRKLKIALSCFVESLAHIGMAIIAIMILLVFFGVNIFKVLIHMIGHYDFLSHRILTATYPNLSSLAIVGLFIVITMIYINTMLATLSIIINSFRSLINIIVERNNQWLKYADIIAIVLPLLLLIFLAGPLRFFIVKLIFYAGYGIGILLHLV